MRSSITAQELHLSSSDGVGGVLDAPLGLLDPREPLRYLKGIFDPPTASLRTLLARFATIATSTPQTRHLADAPCDEACLLAADALRRREIWTAQSTTLPLPRTRSGTAHQIDVVLVICH